MAPPVAALDKDFGNWNAYTAHRYTEDGVQTCNLYTPPQIVDKNRPNAQFNVTNRPQKPHRIAIDMDIQLDTTRAAVLQIKNTEYTLIAYETYVFVSKTDQAAVIYKMKMGAKFTVTATAIDGNTTSDTYSLMGFTRALQTIDRYC